MSVTDSERNAERREAEGTRSKALPHLHIVAGVNVYPAVTVAHPSSPVRIINVIAGEAVAADVGRIVMRRFDARPLAGAFESRDGPGLGRIPLLALHPHTVYAVAHARSAVPFPIRAVGVFKLLPSPS